MVPMTLLMVVLAIWFQECAYIILDVFRLYRSPQVKTVSTVLILIISKSTQQQIITVNVKSVILMMTIFRFVKIGVEIILLLKELENVTMEITLQGMDVVILVLNNMDIHA